MKLEGVSQILARAKPSFEKLFTNIQFGDHQYLDDRLLIPFVYTNHEIPRSATMVFGVEKREGDAPFVALDPFLSSHMSRSSSPQPYDIDWRNLYLVLYVPQIRMLEKDLRDILYYVANESM
jgi:hypothetical protein